MAAVPAEFRSLGTAPTVTRGQLAALVGIRLEPVLDKVTQRVTPVATDVRGHWAAPWILPVTQTGVMDVYPNHTFQPAARCCASDLARVVSQLLTIIAAQRSTDLAKWRAARPVFPDLPASNVYYGSAALAVSAGAMSALDDNGSRRGRPPPARPSRPPSPACSRSPGAQEPMTVLTAANQLTLLRLVLVPVFVALHAVRVARLGADGLRDRRRSPTRSTA